MRKDKIRSVRQVTENGHLNFFELEAVDRLGHTFPYYMASRAGTEQELYMNAPDKGPDGVTIVTVCGEDHDKVVLVRQFRYAVGTHVYEFPAGLVEPGEDIHEAASREVREETGMTLEVLSVPPWLERPFFMTDGMTDEACSYVFGYAVGEPNTAGLEQTEDLQIVIADRREAARILQQERVALSCALVLLRFITDAEPFAFLERLSAV